MTTTGTTRTTGRGLYRTCPDCDGFCFVGRDPNNRPKPCLTCNATGRLYTGGRK
ncbi:hypothetical protein GCM10023194_40920 [Planotetraspora phitsanulokensis]|uniref:Uncharacterized protein n=2 Tax=Planotetraspora phitsanulokensis TaxID=575192 RepID=A0A8J3ULI1_9ACTN|nr:hypothetical protein Pph01_59230 [Planotetraspora phitsanulokensis]